MTDERRDFASGAQPSVGSGESIEDTLRHLYYLPLGEQTAVLRVVIPRVLGRQLEPQRERFLASLRSVPRGEAKISEPPTSGEPPESPQKVASDILNQPFDAQLHIVRLAATRVVAELDGPDRERFIDSLDDAIYKVEAGEAPPAGP